MSRITQLHPQIELYSDGEPPQHNLFVLGKDLAPPLSGGDQLLLVDPPDDAASRFSLPERSAALFTGVRGSAPIAQIETRPGGVAHIRIGEHLVDVHSQHSATVVHLPAIGLLLSGAYRF